MVSMGFYGQEISTRRTTVHLRACTRPKQKPLSRALRSTARKPPRKRFIVESTRNIWTPNPLVDRVMMQHYATRCSPLKGKYICISSNVFFFFFSGLFKV